ncbi:IclR family transcriptional regulator [Bradyrhizobium sp. Pha-3]|uniref:IclR family transcriptional regulator n=1 Tax=Bradyrhizobium sp. Pha-3 TaxID=208375 RepID=UPI0035D47E8D
MSDRSIKSAERTLAIFELFSVRQEMLTVGDVSKSLDIPQPSVSMLLKNLTNMGYLEYDAPQRRYAPTLRVMLLNSWLLDRYEGTAKFVPILKSLLLELQETVFIGMQNKSTAQYILVMTPKNRDSLLITSGMHRSLTCSAMGRILLSMTGEEELHRWIRRCNAEATDPRFRVREAPYLDLIAADRSKGYAETAGDISPGFGAIAVAVPSPLGGTPLAIGAGARVERIAQKRGSIVLGLRHAASLIATRQPLTDTDRPAAEASVEAEGAPTAAGGPQLSTLPSWFSNRFT